MIEELVLNKRVKSSQEILPPRGECTDPDELSPPGLSASNPAAASTIAVHHAWSDQDNALKFRLDFQLLPFGEKRTYANREEACASPLALEMFGIGNVESVEIENTQITVTMNENSDWEKPMEGIPAVIQEFFRCGNAPFLEEKSVSDTKKFSFGFKEVNSRPREEQMKIVNELFNEEVNPAIAAHGGFFKLLDIQDNNVYVELGGGCQGCSMANVTLRQGVEERLRQVLPEMASLIDSTDHASGTNPYYQESKK